MPSTTTTTSKTTASQVNVGAMVSRKKSGPYAKVTSLSPGQNSVWITFEDAARIRPNFDSPLWVQAETAETPAPAPKAPKAKPAAKPAPAAFEWPKPAAELFAAYLEQRTSAAANAPHLGLPFITEKGILRVKPSDWLGHLAAKQIDAPKRTALEALREQGLVQRVYPLPTVAGQEHLVGKSFGLYTGKATPAMATLPRRESAAPAAKPAADKPAAEAKPAAASDDVAQVAAKDLKVGDLIATSRKAATAGSGDTVGAITHNAQGRVQARHPNGKMIESYAPATKVWRRAA